MGRWWPGTGESAEKKGRGGIFKGKGDASRQGKEEEREAAEKEKEVEDAGRDAEDGEEGKDARSPGLAKLSRRVVAKTRSIEELRRLMGRQVVDEDHSLNISSRRTTSFVATDISPDTPELIYSSVPLDGSPLASNPVSPATTQVFQRSMTASSDGFYAAEEFDEESILRWLKVVTEADTCSDRVETSGEAGAVEDAQDCSARGNLVELQQATRDLWNMSKVSRGARQKMVELGVLTAMVPLLSSSDAQVQENAVRVLLNLSLEMEGKIRMIAAKALLPLMRTAKEGITEKSREIAIGALSSLSVAGPERIEMLEIGAVELLLEVFGSGSTQARRDAAGGLFNLALNARSRINILRGGCVKTIMDILDTPGAYGVEQESMKLLSSLSKYSEACGELENPNFVQILVGVLESGETDTAKINAAACLLRLAELNEKWIPVIKDKDALFPLIALSQGPSPRGRLKGLTLLNLLRACHTTI